MLNQLLQRPIAFHRIFAQIAGSATGGLFLSQLWFWKDKGHDKDGWIYKTYEEWQDETLLSRSELDRARSRLRKLGILEEQKKGVPCKIYYRINETRLESELIQFAESNKQDRRIQQTRLQDPTNKNAESDKLDCEIQQTRMQNPANILYTEITPENTAETTRNYAHGEARPQEKLNKKFPEETRDNESVKAVNPNFLDPLDHQDQDRGKFSAVPPNQLIQDTSNREGLILPKEQQRGFWRALTAYIEKTNPKMSRGRAESIASASTERLLNQVPKVQDQEYLELYLQGILPCYADDRITYQTIKEHQTLEELRGMLYD